MVPSLPIVFLNKPAAVPKCEPCDDHNNKSERREGKNERKKAFSVNRM